MELKLEGIVETLLVGAMASLLVLSVVFFAFGHIWNVRVMRRFFDTLFGERSGPESEDFSGKVIVADRDESGPSPATFRGASRSRKDNGGEGHLSFGLILLLALLYGLGIIAEAGSHAVTHEDNQAEKQRSFQIVALGKLASGTASHRLSRFISDYNACRNLKLKPSRDREHPSLCQQLDDRVSQFFYNAKNAVFQQREYYEELSVLEARINFMRSFEWLSRGLLFELAVVFAIAFIAEFGKRRLNKPWRNLMEKIFRQTRRAEVHQGTFEPVRESGPPKLRDEWFHAAIKFGDHWVKVAAFHVLLLVGACSVLLYFSHIASAYSEDQFSRRVFGYYFALEAAQERPGAETGRDLTPESPYHMFSLLPEGASQTPVPPSSAKSAESRNAQAGSPQPEHPKQRRFEPSAVQILGNTSQVLVASDQGGSEPFWLFSLDENAIHMDNPRQPQVTAIDPSRSGTLLPVQDPASDARLKFTRHGTIESLAAFESSAPENQWVPGSKCEDRHHRKTFRVFAGPSSFGPNENERASLLSFCLTIDPSTPEIQQVQEERVQSPCPKIFSNDRCTVEGMAFRKAEHGTPELLLGVQKTGEKSTLAIIRLHQKLQPETGDRIWDDGEKIFPSGDDKCSADSGIDAMLRAGGGVSDLAAAPSGRVYVTTSLQSGPDGAQTRGGSAGAPSVGGALWLVDLGCNAAEPRDPCRCSEQKATLLETFIHKPDGVSHDNGSVLVVFDDEAWRKSHQWAPKTFPLGQNEAVFAIVPSPEFR